MNFTVEKNEQYALVRLTESQLSEEIVPDFEKLSQILFREGYSNIIVDIAPVQSVDQAGVMTLRKVNRQCTSEDGLLIMTTKNDGLIELLDKANLELVILPTVEEAIDAVFMHELENDFRSEDDDEYDHGGSVES